MHVVDHTPLAPLTTIRLGGVARRLVHVERESELCAAVRELDQRQEPLLVLGGGSNLVIGDDGFPGTAVRIATRGRSALRDGDRVLVTAQAGEPWDDFVKNAVDEGLAGVECLAGIPGLVGATPMQNVGAYGQDVSDTIVSLRAWDRERNEIVTFDRAACAFAYRSSIFRGKHRHVIVEVTFALTPGGQSRPIRYAELSRGLGIAEHATAPVATVRDIVIALRRKKGMVLDAADPDTVSAGSFFTNPILDRAALAAFQARTEGLVPPTFPEPDGRSKVSAGWLIEAAGFTKGYGAGRVGVSSKHALALVNRGGSTAELLDLARTIRAGVHARFGVTLENEPVFVGVSL